MFLVITRNFPPDIGGMQALMGGLSESLLNHGPVKVFAYQHIDSHLYDNKTSADIERVKGIKLFRKYRKANIVNEFFNKNSNIRAVFTDHWKSLELLKAEHLQKTKTFCLIHSKEINHDKNTSINKRIIKSTNKADFVIANSNFTKNLGINIGIDEKKIHVINPGINKPKKIENLSKLEAEKIYGESFPKIITIARLDKRKGHDKILMLIKNLKAKFPKIKYISIGSGDQERDLIQLSKELSIDKEVIFLKKIQEDFKLALLSESNLFLMPTRKVNNSVEGFGISFIEAASYGVSSIGGREGGSGDAIYHNKTGLLCDGSDLNSIYNSVTTILENEKYIKFGKEAKSFSENFYWNKIVRKYLNLIN